MSSSEESDEWDSDEDEQHVTKKRRQKKTWEFSLDRKYRKTWKASPEGIREVVQNLIDGGFVYAEAHLTSTDGRVSSQKQLKPTTSDFMIQKLNKPPAGIKANFAYEARLILSLDGKSSTSSRKKWTKEWTENTYAVACITCSYATDEQFKPEDVHNGYLDGSSMYMLVAENRAHRFNIYNLLVLGGSTKNGRPSRGQAGKFGDGIKTGALAIVRDGCRIDIQGGGKSCRFVIKDSKREPLLKELLQAKLGEPRKRYKDNQDLVGVRIQFAHRGNDFCLEQGLRFEHDFFRIIDPKRMKGAVAASDGEDMLLLDPKDKGKIFCKSIFVVAQENLYFGYDLELLTLPVERNFVAKPNELKRLIGKLMQDIFLRTTDDHKIKIKDLIIDSMDEASSQSMLEAQVMTYDEWDPNKKIAQEIKSHFSTRFGKDTFPCLREDVAFAKTRLPGRIPRAVQQQFLQILQRGGYRSLRAEEEALYSKENKTRKSINNTPFSLIIENAIARIRRAGLKDFSPDKLFFLQESKLPTKRSETKLMGGICFVNDKLLRGDCIDDEALMLAYHILQAIGEDDLIKPLLLNKVSPVMANGIAAKSDGTEAIIVSLSDVLASCRGCWLIVLKLNCGNKAEMDDGNDSSSANTDNESDGSRKMSSSLVFRAKCEGISCFRVSKLSPGTFYKAFVKDSDGKVVEDSNNGTPCEVRCRTDLIFKEPSTISVFCFPKSQRVLTQGCKHMEVGIRYKSSDMKASESWWQPKQTNEPKPPTNWARLGAEEAAALSPVMNVDCGASVTFVARNYDSEIHGREEAVSILEKFTFCIPNRSEIPAISEPALLIKGNEAMDEWIFEVDIEGSQKKGAMAFVLSTKDQRDVFIQTNWERMESSYSVKVPRELSQMSYCIHVAFRVSLDSETIVWSVSEPLNVVEKEEAPIPCQESAARESVADSRMASKNTKVGNESNDFFGYIQARVEDDYDGDSDYVDSDDDYDLEDEDLDRAFHYDDEGTEETPRAGSKSEVSRLSLDGKIYIVGETYRHQIRPIWYTIVSLHPQRKPPKAECEVDMLLTDTFMGNGDLKKFDAGTTVRCDGPLQVVPLHDLGEKEDERPQSKIAHVREKGRKDMTYYSLGEDNQYGNSSSSASHLHVGIELFAGIGGASIALEEVLKGDGVKTCWFVEKDYLAASHLKQRFNKDDQTVLVMDVREFMKEAKEGNPIYPKRGEILFIWASPPCQGYSRANRYGGKNDNENNNLTYIFAEAVVWFQPLVAVMENVTGILHEKNRRRLREVMSILLSHQYQLRMCVLDASNYGDPQKRKRMFLIAVKNGHRLPDSPIPTHGDRNSDLEPYYTVKDAIGDHEKPTSTGYASYEDGETTYNHKMEPALELNSWNSQNVEAISRNLASTTIRSTKHKHYDENEKRLLTVRECADLSSFPRDFQLFGPRTKLMKFIANAVPVGLGTAVGKLIKEAIDASLE